jgi:hypothetical protein
MAAPEEAELHMSEVEDEEEDDGLVTVVPQEGQLTLSPPIPYIDGSDRHWLHYAETKELAVAPPGSWVLGHQDGFGYLSSTAPAEEGNKAPPLWATDVLRIAIHKDEVEKHRWIQDRLERCPSVFFEPDARRTVISRYPHVALPIPVRGEATFVTKVSEFLFQPVSGCRLFWEDRVLVKALWEKPTKGAKPIHQVVSAYRKGLRRCLPKSGIPATHLLDAGEKKRGKRHNPSILSESSSSTCAEVG